VNLFNDHPRGLIHEEYIACTAETCRFLWCVFPALKAPVQLMEANLKGGLHPAHAPIIDQQAMTSAIFVPTVPISIPDGSQLNQPNWSNESGR
jgi:hypothetical protein